MKKELNEKRQSLKNKKSHYVLALVLVVLIWGTVPNVSKLLLGYYSPAIKTAVSALVAFSAMLIYCSKKLKGLNKEYFKFALPTGVFYSLACVLQQVGLNKTTPTMYAFLENLSCLTVPVLVWVLTKKRPLVFQFIAAALCLLSVYILGGAKLDGSFGIGDALCGVAGIFYGVNIAVTGVKAKKLDTGLYLLVQFGVHLIISTVYALVFEDVTFSLKLWPLALLVAVTLISTVFGWLLRTACLKRLSPTFVSVVMPFSSAVTAIVSVVIGNDALSGYLVVGALVGVIAAIVSEIDPKIHKGSNKNMIKILQYGEGNFLRTFVDAYFDTLNKEGGAYEVNIVKPIPFGSLENFKLQDNKYNVVLRGVKDGSAVESVYPINVVNRVIDPFLDQKSYLALALDKDLKLIVSNTTEAGVCFNENDKMDGFENITYPAKLTKFLYERYKNCLGGVYLLPVELIDDNGDALKNCVDKYIELWGLDGGFKRWNDEENFYLNTLVDRIVSGYPKDDETRAHLTELIGKEDALASVGEPFGLWAIEDKGDISAYIKDGVHNIEVVLTKDIKYYKKRKVRVLNGSHTNIVPVGIVLGANTVYDCMVNERLHKFFEGALKEIIPFVSNDVSETERFARAVEERFFNPYLNHQLWSIALNGVSKWGARVLPTFKDYYAFNGRIPEKLTVGFSYFIRLYKTRLAEIKDDERVKEIFSSTDDLKVIMSSAELWGEDLTKYDGFYETVAENLERINKGEVLI